jgi:serine protease Do
VARGWLGVLIQEVTRELAESFGMKRPHGALVAKVLEDSPAAKAGLEVGDVIVEYNGRTVNYSSDLPPLVGRTKVGEEAKIKVIRGGKSRVLTVEIAELPSEEELQLADKEPGTASDNRLNVVVSDLSAEQRKQLELSKNGVLVQEDKDGAASKAGIRRGDIIVKLNNVYVENASHFKRLVEDLKPGRSVPVLVQRRDGPLFLALKVPEE